MKTTKTYVTAVARHEVKQSLLDRLLRRKPVGPWKLDISPCPHCKGEVKSLTPNTITEQWDDGFLYQQHCWIEGLDVIPCGHRVDHFVYVAEGHEHLLVEEILRMERDD